MKTALWKKMMASCLAGSMVLAMAACGNASNQTDVEKTTETEKTTAADASSTDAQEADSYFNKEGFPICDDPITITTVGPFSGTPDWNDTDWVHTVKEEFGIALDCTVYPGDQWENQYTLMIASDELPDILAPMWRPIYEVNEYGEQGYFLPINEYLDYMPNFKAFLEEHPDYEAAITAPDGNIYGLTNISENKVNMQKTFINGEWLKNVGMEIPTNVDELYDVLKAFKEKDANGNGDSADEIPLSGDFTTLTPFLHAFGIYSNTMAYSPIWDEAGNVILGQATDNYKAMLKYVKQLCDEGLYDAEGLIQTNDELRAKFAEERIGCYTTGSAPYVDAGREEAYNGLWRYFGGLLSDYNDVNVAVISSGIQDSVKVAVSADTEYPEAICRLIDFLYTAEGAISSSYGFLGVSTEMVEKDYLDGEEIVVVKQPEGYASAEEYRYKKAVINNAFQLRNAYYGTEAEVFTRLSESALKVAAYEYGKFRADMELAHRSMTEVDVFPVLAYTSEESSKRATLLTDIKMYIEQAFGQFITGELDIDKNWENYLNTLEQIGLSELMKIEQAAYDRAYK